MTITRMDIIIGAPGPDASAGQAYIIFGKSTFTSPFSLSNLNGNNGFVISGSGQTGWSVSSAGDINGDDISDIIVGAPWTENYETGQAYVIYGEDFFSFTFGSF
ncbi:MAG: integrin alpha [Candidatus Midichloria sp.]|nr:integrin alpha [Candidatus Midichloria sp.]